MKLQKRDQRPLASWKTRLKQLVAQLVRRQGFNVEYARANAAAVLQTTEGKGPDSSKVDPRAGARMVVNLSSAHVPGFCAASKLADPCPYKNGYDLQRLGLGKAPSWSRATVDACLPLPAGKKPDDVYFGAVELNGAGIRFYGDVCLVLRKERVPPETVLIDRNSYDVLRSPFNERASTQAQRIAVIRSSHGLWGRDLGPMAAIKAIVTVGLRDRRWTTGHASEGIRTDEDYLEVLKLGSFAVADLQEARISAAEAGHDALVASRMSRRPRPRLESMIWRYRRSRAEMALRELGVPTRIVTTAGRVRD